MVRAHIRFKNLMVVIIALLAFLLEWKQGKCFADLTDQLVRRATGTAVELVKGNKYGALQQAVPSANWQPMGQTNLTVGAGGVSLHEKIQPLEQLGTKYLNVAGAYNAAGYLNPNGTPNLSQNVQVSSGNQFVSNTTTFSPTWRKR